MHQPTVIYPNTHHFANRRQVVSGMGWLIRHASLIDRIEVVKNEYKTVDRDHDVVISAYCFDGKMFTSEFNSVSILWQWLQRPSLLGIKLMWLGQGIEIKKGVKMPELA